MPAKAKPRGIERSIEWEHAPAALELGMWICIWSPLASGLLTGKYKPVKKGPEPTGQLLLAVGVLPASMFPAGVERRPGP